MCVRQRIFISQLKELGLHNGVHYIVIHGKGITPRQLTIKVLDEPVNETYPVPNSILNYYAVKGLLYELKKTGEISGFTNNTKDKVLDVIFKTP